MPTDMTRYPPNWASEIRPLILKRAGNRCEWCEVANGAIGHRNSAGVFNECLICRCGGDCDLPRAVRIVLTVAHVFDPDPRNCALGNLAALCQQCHNRHDAPMRRAHAAETRRRREVAGGQAELMLEED